MEFYSTAAGGGSIRLARQRDDDEEIDAKATPSKAIPSTQRREDKVRQWLEQQKSIAATISDNHDRPVPHGASTRGIVKNAFPDNQHPLAKIEPSKCQEQKIDVAGCEKPPMAPQLRQIVSFAETDDAKREEKSPPRKPQTLYRLPSLSSSKPASIDSSHSLDHAQKAEPSMNDQIRYVLRNLKENTGEFIPDDTSIEIIMKAIAIEMSWTNEEIQEDIRTLLKYRIKSARLARMLTENTWSEMKQLPPIVKDSVKRAIGWKAR
ncbi:hypothetical protein HDU83_005062 [Entophlyctis luteolus]|nr:hypothetical protein HDU83_005062 [Entophlyctis luteolus]KAJ3388022.1 hypothetical protein HDU84_000346 [Entophlyctis sp. JEL0112]